MGGSDADKSHGGQRSWLIRKAAIVDTWARSDKTQQK